MTAKEILLDELNEQVHPVQVEEVIFWALGLYANTQHKAQWGTIVAATIRDRIISESSEFEKE